MSWLDDLAKALVNVSGNGFNANGCQLPEYRATRLNTAKLPENKKKQAVDIVDDGLYTDDEIEAMSDAEFAIKVGGARTKAAFRQSENIAPKKKNTIVFDDVETIDTHGITEREYGEMLAYTPSLRDVKLAAAIKNGIEKGKTLRAIAGEVKQSYQLVRHYSSALSKAKND